MSKNVRLVVITALIVLFLNYLYNNGFFDFVTKPVAEIFDEETNEEQLEKDDEKVEEDEKSEDEDDLSKRIEKLKDEMARLDEGSDLEDQDSEKNEINEEDQDSEKDEINEEDLDVEKEMTAEEEKALILSYYEKLEAGKLEEAYAMKYEEKASFKQFEGWYEKVLDAEVSEMQELADSKYRYKVVLKESDGTTGEYRTEMQVIGGKLKTISAYQISNSGEILKATFNKDLYVIVEDDGKNVQKLYLNRDGNKTLLTKLEYFHEGDYKIRGITEVGFDPKGWYLWYTQQGMEGSSFTLMNLENFKKVNMLKPHDFGFTSDYKFFFACEHHELQGGSLSSVMLPKMTNGVDTYQNYPGVYVHSCLGYDPATNTYLMEASYDKKNIYRARYHFDIWSLKPE